MRVILFDIDGTLVGDSKIIDPSVINHINELKSAGYKIGLTTGRSLWETLPVIDVISPDFPTVCLDGRIIFDHQNSKVINTNSLKGVELNEILEIEKMEYTRVIWEDNNGFIVKDKMSRKLLSMAFSIPNNKIEIIPDYNGIVLKAYIYHQNSISEVYKKIQRNNAFEVYLPGSKWIVLSKAKISKFTALKFLCDKFNINLNEIIAFGDGDNDYDLLRYVGLGVAMNNATESLKRVADVIAGDVNESGVTNILSNILFNERKINEITS